MTESPKVLWTVRRDGHEYRAELRGLGDQIELVILRDGAPMFAERWPSEQAVIDEAEKYRALLVGH